MGMSVMILWMLMMSTEELERLGGVCMVTSTSSKLGLWTVSLGLFFSFLLFSIFLLLWLRKPLTVP